MAKQKKLPWFPFDCHRWLGGKIMLQTPEAQGVFMAACSLWWRDQQDFPIKDLKARYRQCRDTYEKALADLVEDGLLDIIDENISVPWLVELLPEQQEKHQKKVESGRLGGRAKAEASKSVASPESASEKASNATSKPTNRIDKNREDKTTTAAAAVVPSDDVAAPAPAARVTMKWLSNVCMVKTDSDRDAFQGLIDMVPTKDLRMAIAAVRRKKNKNKESNTRAYHSEVYEALDAIQREQR